MSRQRASRDVVERRRAGVPEITYPADLPITQHREALLAAIGTHQVVIVAGETGSGKSTQLPKLCLELGRGVKGMIGHTQPRRVAARTVAERIADELHCELGTAIGYAVRFTDRVSDQTLVKVMTDGLLLAEIQRDRRLLRYDTIIVDEAHERSLNIDFLLGYLTHLLPQRPDLKLIVTSATIDTEQFSRHFGDVHIIAPIITVSGRAHPVELRYRPFGVDPEDERDQVTALADAVEELSREGPGDILVFLSGEREIHDAADMLRKAELRETEILPLYARMSAVEQHHVFEPHVGRRVILATNVAETSITVPGVRYVVDAGTARISRYSRRLKVQRLPIEAVSQASANQRAGRCGRVAPGIAIRLYSDDDFAQRPLFTEPEILRTSLASVILQMSALGLGDIASFPFVEPPDPRSITDGINLLDELGAFERVAAAADDTDEAAPRRLTPLGRRLAQLPVDPRFGRMVLESDRLGCAREVMVIAAALSIQDPRERPAARLEAATQAHQRFAGEDGSDFMAFVRLWDHLRTQQRSLSGNQFRRLCRDEFLNYLRVREWQDLYSQLRQIAGGIGVRLNSEHAHPDHVHQALLAGLLSHLGMRDGESKEFRGARGAKFMIGRGSAQAKRPARWVIAAELVETNRLWGRVAARVQPEWAEQLGRHLVKYHYGEPEWSAERGSASVLERVTLYGLPIVTNRRIQLSRVDPALAREMFIHHALVEGEWEADHAFLDHNRGVLDDVRSLAERTRRPDLEPDAALVAAFYDERVPADITSTRHFDRWWRQQQRTSPHLLDLTRDVVVRGEVVALDDFPDAWADHEPALPLSYGFDPGRHDDGITVSVPLVILNQMDPEPFGWLVPGLREELIGSYVKSLPKVLRRHLIPAAEHIRMATVHLRDGPVTGEPTEFRAALAQQLTVQCGETIDADAFAVDSLPAHLLVTFAVKDTEGRVVATSKDLRSLRLQLRAAVRAEIASLVGPIERDDVKDWTFGPLPLVVEALHQGHVVRGYPALIDDGERVQLRVLTTPEAAARASHKGIRRLLLTTLPLPRKSCARVLTNDMRLALARLGWRTAVDLVDECIATAIDHLMRAHGTTPCDERSFRTLQGAVASALTETAMDVTRTSADVAVAAARTSSRLDGITTAPFRSSVLDIRQQLAGLVHPGFVAAAGHDQVQHILRYIRAIEHRLDKLSTHPERDRLLMRRIHELEREHAALLDQHRRSETTDDQRRHTAAIGWMIQELRVSLFAQPVGTAHPVSEQRVRRELQSQLLQTSGVRPSATVGAQST